MFTPTSGYRRPAALLPLIATLVIMAAACSSGRSNTAVSPVKGGASAVGSAVPGSDGRGSVGVQSRLPGSSESVTPAKPAGLGSDVAPAQAQVVRNANVIVDVSRGAVPASYDEVVNLATANGGFVADSSLTTTQAAVPSGRLTLRIPVDHLSSVLTALGRVGKVGQQDQQGTDVTGQLVDLAARIRTLQAEEDATRTLLGRAQAIGDILQIQGQLFNLRTQIEQLNGQQAQLNDKATYATIAVQIVESGPAGPPRRPQKPKAALPRAWALAGHNILAVLDGAALAAGWLSPLLIIAVLAAGPLLWWRRRSSPTPVTTVPAD